MSKRRVSYLVPKKDKARKSKLAVVDIEANNWIEFEMLGFYDGDIYRQFNELTEFFDAIIRKQYRGYKIYAHFGGKYDFQFFLQYFKERKDQFGYALVTQGAKIIQMKVKRGKDRWTFCDSSALFPNLSLDKLSKSFDVAHKKKSGAIDFEGGEKVDRNNPDHCEYLRYDCLSLYEVIKKFQENPLIEKEGLNLTLASQALNTWRHTLKHTIKVNYKYISNFIRSGYVGGRVEIFKLKGEGLNYYDVNSLYPFSMLGNRIPTEFKEHVNDVCSDLGFYDVTLIAPDCYIPLLPVRHDTKLIFPLGEFRGVYFSEELKFALERGYKIKKFHKGVSFYESTSLFNDYINMFYEVKKNAPKGSAEELIAKLMMNSLYGKFGQREERTKIKTLERGDTNYVPYHSPQIFEETGLITIKEEHRAPYMLPQIAAAITSYARLHMAKLCFIDNPETRYYTDTDSILTTQQFKTGPELGELKLEEIEVVKGEPKIPLKDVQGVFMQPKAYQLTKDNQVLERKIKGFPKDFIKGLSRDEFEKFDFQYKKTIFASFKRSLISNHSFLSMIDLEKKVKSSYSKRRIIQGGDTEPWILKNGVIINSQ